LQNIKISEPSAPSKRHLVNTKKFVKHGKNHHFHFFTFCGRFHCGTFLFFVLHFREQPKCAKKRFAVDKPQKWSLKIVSWKITKNTKCGRDSNMAPFLIFSDFVRPKMVTESEIKGCRTNGNERFCANSAQKQCKSSASSVISRSVICAQVEHKNQLFEENWPTKHIFRFSETTMVELSFTQKHVFCSIKLNFIKKMHPGLIRLYQICRAIRVFSMETVKTFNFLLNL